MIQLYRVIPIDVKAVQWLGHNIDEIKNFVGDKITCKEIENEHHPIYKITVNTPDGDCLVWKGDYIAKFASDRFYVFSSGDFLSKFEEIKGE